MGELVEVSACLAPSAAFSVGQGGDELLAGEWNADDSSGGREDICWGAQPKVPLRGAERRLSRQVAIPAWLGGAIRVCLR